MDFTLKQPARARLITAQDQEIPVAVALRYLSGDPLAVHFDFPPEASLSGEDVTWSFARDLLAEGLRTPAGGGDVHIWPCGRSRTVLEFHAVEGMALLQFDTAALQRFLLRSYAVVAVGMEDVDQALDQGLTSLLGEV
jgi:hypothetical protein